MYDFSTLYLPHAHTAHSFQVGGGKTATEEDVIEQRRLWGTNALAQAQTKSLFEVIVSNFVNAITAILGE